MILSTEFVPPCAQHNKQHHRKVLEPQCMTEHLILGKGLLQHNIRKSANNQIDILYLENMWFFFK